jgi:hypothetical protein
VARLIFNYEGYNDVSNMASPVMQNDADADTDQVSLHLSHQDLSLLKQKSNIGL